MATGICDLFLSVTEELGYWWTIRGLLLPRRCSTNCHHAAVAWVMAIVAWGNPAVLVGLLPCLAVSMGRNALIVETAVSVDGVGPHCWFNERRD